MKKLIIAFMLLNAASATAAEGDPCPISSGTMVTKFVGIINDGSQDVLASDGSFNLRVPSTLTIKFSGGLTELAINEQLKFTTSVKDANNYCIATLLEARPNSIKTSGGGSKLRGGDGV